MFVQQPIPYINEEHRGVFARTQHLPGWQDPGDTDKLYELGYHHGDRILEIGVYGGRSAVVELLGALANPARQQPPQFLGVDLDVQAYLRSHKSLEEFGLAPHTAIFVGTLQDLYRDYSWDPTMVFVDGDHSYEGAKSDLNLLRTIVRPGPPVICHDYTNGDNDTGALGVRRAVDEFVKEGGATFEGVYGVSAMLKMNGVGPLPSAAGVQPTFSDLQKQFTNRALTKFTKLFEDLTEAQEHAEGRLNKLKESHSMLRTSYERLKARHQSLKSDRGQRAGSSLGRLLGKLGLGK